DYYCSSFAGSGTYIF
nr:immunoglobulin light chain junction region [Macaca mulatta]MOW69941.1 immunoglobulin light chain junction region [Macaca mulatta]